MSKPRSVDTGRYFREYSTDEIISAIHATNGMIAIAAQTLGCSRDTIYKRMKKYPEIKAAVDEAREYMVDLAESKLRLAILNGEPWAIALALKTIGKHRGYVERIEQTGIDGSAQRVEIYLPENTRDQNQIESEIVDADTDTTD